MAHKQRSVETIFMASVLYPRTFSTDLNILSCKTFEETPLLCWQEPSGPWGLPVGRHLPYDFQKLKRKQCQLQYRKAVILLAALRVDRADPSLRRIIQAWIEHEKLLRLLNPYGIIIYQDLDGLCPEGPIHIQAEVVKSNVPILANLTGELTEPEDPAQADGVHGTPFGLA